MRPITITTTHLPQLIRADLPRLQHPGLATLHHHLQQPANRAEAAADSDDPSNAKTLLDNLIHLRRNSFHTGAGGWLNLPAFQPPRHPLPATSYQLHTHDNTDLATALTAKRHQQRNNH